jgi:sugar fermentation stimulation protein A
MNFAYRRVPERAISQAMRFPYPVLRGTLIQRYKRFLADVRLDDGRTVTATCPNTGSMLGLTSPGSTVWLSQSDSLTRKYRFTWEMVEADLGYGPTLVGINTQHPNALVAEAMSARRIKALTGYPAFRREVRYGENSRIDILLECAKKGLCYVEVKNVHLSRRHGLAEFPDSVTVRGTKHLMEMTNMVRAGHRVVMQRDWRWRATLMPTTVSRSMRLWRRVSRPSPCAAGSAPMKSSWTGPFQSPVEAGQGCSARYVVLSLAKGDQCSALSA